MRDYGFIISGNPNKMEQLGGPECAHLRDAVKKHEKNEQAVMFIALASEACALHDVVSYFEAVDIYKREEL